MRRPCRDLSSDTIFVHFGEGLRLIMLSVCLSCLYTPVLCELVVLLAFNDVHSCVRVRVFWLDER